eukprot:EG_transcript_24921
MPTQCGKCGRFGHKPRECRQRPLAGWTPRKERTTPHCTYCNLAGHRDVAGQCPYRVEFAQETVAPCKFCSSLMHPSSRCPEHQRQMRTKSIICPICLEKGHWVDTCTKAGRIKALPKRTVRAFKAKLAAAKEGKAAKGKRGPKAAKDAKGKKKEPVQKKKESKKKSKSQKAAGQKADA